MPAILAYAKSKNVGVWLWAHWTDIDRQMDEAFPLLRKVGQCRREDRLHESRRPVDGELLPSRGAKRPPSTT